MGGRGLAGDVVDVGEADDYAVWPLALLQMRLLMGETDEDVSFFLLREMTTEQLIIQQIVIQTY